MRFMIIVKANAGSEAGVMPKDDGLMAAMAGYHEELAKAGVLLDANGLKPSSQGWRIRYAGGRRKVVDGPFAETKEIIAGYWVWQVRSMEEAVEWVRRCPDPMPGEDAEIEIRPIFEASDFGQELTPELRAQEERLRLEVERQNRVSRS
jgi:hypothetical protein